MPNSVRKHITVKEHQAEWVDDKNINLSRLVQDALEERIDN